MYTSISTVTSWRYKPMTLDMRPASPVYREQLHKCTIISVWYIYVYAFAIIIYKWNYMQKKI